MVARNFLEQVLKLYFECNMLDWNMYLVLWCFVLLVTYHNLGGVAWYIHPSYESCGIYGLLEWRNNGCDSVSNHQPHDCLLNRLSRRRSKKTSKLRVTGLCAGNSPGTGEFPAQRASNAEMFSFDDVIMLVQDCRNSNAFEIGFL